MKKVIIITLSIILVMACSIPVLSQDGIYAQKVDFSIYMNHVLTAFKEPIYLINDRTYVPLRELSEKQDFEVVWDGANSSIDLIKEEKEVAADAQMLEMLKYLNADSLDKIQKLMTLKCYDPLKDVFDIMQSPGELIGFGAIIYQFNLDENIRIQVYSEANHIYQEGNNDRLLLVRLFVDDKQLELVPYNSK